MESRRLQPAIRLASNGTVQLSVDGISVGSFGFASDLGVPLEMLELALRRFFRFFGKNGRIEGDCMVQFVGLVVLDMIYSSAQSCSKARKVRWRVGYQGF